jgi:hypothetical protein
MGLESSTAGLLEEVDVSADADGAESSSLQAVSSMVVVATAAMRMGALRILGSLVGFTARSFRALSRLRQLGSQNHA